MDEPPSLGSTCELAKRNTSLIWLFNCTLKVTYVDVLCDVVATDAAVAWYHGAGSGFLDFPWYISPACCRGGEELVRIGPRVAVLGIHVSSTLGIQFT